MNPQQTLLLVLTTAAVLAILASFITAAIVNLLAVAEAAVGHSHPLKP